MVSNLDITLVIPSHNRAKLILETIGSALNQTSGFAKIIVVDDASTDDTLFQLKQFNEQILVIPSEKVGVQAARNIGVEAATTEYVALCDSDDLLEPNFVETVSKWLAEHKDCDSIYSNFVTFDNATISPNKFSAAPPSFFRGSVREGNFCTNIPNLYTKTVNFQPLFSSGVAIKKSFYQRIGGYNPAMNGIGSEDWEYTLRAIEAGKIAVCMLPLVKIRRHSGNDSSNKIRQLLGEVTVLEYALNYHKSASQYQTELSSGIRIRKIQAFELAFGEKEYVYADEILRGIYNYPRSGKFYVKAIITKFISFTSSSSNSREISTFTNPAK